jgi:uncharacterized membrane protein
LVGGLSPWATLLVALAAVALLIFDATELTDYALFGLALGGAVASRINVAPLAGIIVVAAVLRALPALDRKLNSTARNRLIAYALTGVMTAAVMSFIVFRLLQPHAFLGPGILGLKFNPGWRQDMSEASYLTSGNWDAPPNHQWASRTPYFFPWRNIVLWGLGIPLGLVAWAAWAWAGITMVRGRTNWTRHTIPFVWTLVCFGWLGGRWVTTMRYFLPIYPMLALFAAWALIALMVGAWRLVRAQPAAVRRLAFAGSVVLLIVVTGYTTVYGFAFHTIQRRQLTRVAASRWFYENVPGDFGLWVEGENGARKLVNLGVNYIASPPDVYHLEQGASYEFSFNVTGDFNVRGLTFFRLGDPARDEGDETVRARLFYENPALGRQLLYEGTITADFALAESPYGGLYRLTPDEPPLLTELAADGTPNTYVLDVTALDGGPVMFTRDVTEGTTAVFNDLGLELQSRSDQTLASLGFDFPDQPLITGHGDDIPATPTHWIGSQTLSFTVPIDGTIREMVIPHLGDPLRDADAETVSFTLSLPDGQQTSVTISDDLNRDAASLGAPRTVVFDPSLQVRRFDDQGGRVSVSLVVDAEDPVYTSGPVIAWEGDWDDPIPWPVCPLPDDVLYRDDLPSGMSAYNCASIGMYGGHYQGLKLWLVAEDNDEKRQAMTNALDQADYLVITSNRFYDSLTRIPMRWPMTIAYYDALFDGRLGFDLVKTFESYPELGPFEIPDEILPTDDLPDWLNEYWEAEEAFHVYDHPVVMVFRKTDAYSPDNTRAVLDSVSIRNVNSAISGYVADPDPIGVVTWGAKQASQAPTMLELSENKWDIQREGGTWSDLFDLDALVNRSQVAAVIFWWVLILLAGWMVWPLLFAIFPALPDRAYPAAKIAAWVIVAWVAWVGGTLNILAWTRYGILLILLGLAAVSLAVIWRRRAEFWLYIRANRRHLLLMEALTLLLFLAFLGVRLGNPDLWHGSFGGEKPMDFAYFNAVLRSTVFPPLDPWYAGGYINYYYFGYVIVGAPVKLLGVQPSVAYNLILPTLYAMTGIGVFSIAYNWVRARNVVPGAITNATRDLPPAEDEVEPEDEPRTPSGSAWLAGLLAVILAVVLGNLGTVHVFVTNVAALDGWTQPPLYSQYRQQKLNAQQPDLYNKFYNEEVAEFREDHDGREPATPDELLRVTQRAQQRADAYIDDYTNHPPLLSLWRYEFDNLRDQIGSFFAGLNKAMKGDPLPMHTHRWYWGPTRIITELPGGAGHNAIAEMPYFTFLYGDLHAHMIAFPVTMLALLWLLAEINGAGRGLRTWWEAGLALALGALAVGLLRPTNSWDWITYLLLGAAGLTYVAWLDAVRTKHDAPPSEAAERLWALLKPRKAYVLVWVLLGVIPLAALARIAFYLFRRIQADQQAKRTLALGETQIHPSLTVSSLLLWVFAGLALAVVLYLALLIVLRARIEKRILLNWLGRVALFVVLTFVAALPFTMYFATAYNSVKPWKLETTPLWAYLYVHGLFIFLVVSLLVWQTARWLRRVRVRQLEGLFVPVSVVTLGLIAIVLGSLWYGVREVPAAQLVLPLIAWAALLFFLPDQSPLLRAVYALIVLALAITLGVEIVVLDGDIGRQNTVFKFYLQAWFLFSITGGIGLAWMLRTMNRWNTVVRVVWQSALTILVSIALLYPVLATQARFLDRFNKDETPLTLDGMEYMKYALHGEHGVWFTLDGDYDIIRWMQENVEGTPVIMEAHMYPSEYHWGGRISIYTGLPTILGWTFHQIQQHSLPDMNMLVQTRENNVAAFYGMSGREGIDAALNLIRAYDIEYIVVGTLERAYYDDIVLDPVSNTYSVGHSPGLAKFDQMVTLGLLEEVYSVPRCVDTAVESVEECSPTGVYMDKIYRVVPGATLSDSIAAGS